MAGTAECTGSIHGDVHIHLWSGRRFPSRYTGARRRIVIYTDIVPVVEVSDVVVERSDR